MTSEDIDKMEAGREMDGLIGENVFNMQRNATWDEPCACNDLKLCISGEWPGLPHFSIDITAAWQVMEKIKDGLTFQYYDHKWEAVLDLRNGDFKILASHESFPLTVCRAALKLEATLDQ